MAILDSFKPQRPVMKVCMMGPKAVGKTTVMTAIFNETQSSIYGTSLNLTAKGDTNALLIDRLHLLQSIFAKKKEITDNRPETGAMTATSFESKFEFGFGHIGQEPVIDITLKDFPGEMVVRNQEEVITFIKESHCILIAIDTPHLMERDGEFNDMKNKPEQITNLFKNAMRSIQTEKLVMFIPLKCEKYFHEKRMHEVLAKVESTYATLIGVFRATQKVCCCVSPILTLGDVDFDDFSYEGENVALAPDNCPANVQYKYVGEGKYSPLLCSQPLYSLLLFVAAQYKRTSTNMSLLDILKNLIWRVFKKDDELINDILKMNRSRISNDDKFGYKELCGEYLFKV